MEKEHLCYEYFEGSYDSAEELYNVVKSRFDKLQKRYTNVELRIENIPYDGIYMAFYGIDPDKLKENLLKEKEEAERAEYERLKAKFG